MDNQQLSRFRFFILIFGVFMTSFGVLAFEISLTRIFSVILDYHYTFLVVSIALFGLGLGGAIAHYLTNKSTIAENFSKLAILSIIFPILMALISLLIISTPDLGVSAQIFFAFIPFLVSGTLLAMAYKLLVSQSNVLHFADLLGASVGSLLIIFFVNWVGAIEAVLIISAITLISAVFYSFTSKKKLLLVISLVAVIGISFLAQYSGGSLTVQPATDQGKELQAFLARDPQAKVVQNQWTSFGEVELVSSPADPHEKVIFVDGGAGTSIFHFDGDFNSPNTMVPPLRNSTMYFPYNFVNKDSALVIGPGGGVDVLTALMAGVNQIYAVDVNPGIVNLVKQESAFDGGIYTNYNNVHVTVDDGRSYIRRSDQKYDNIILDIPVTKTSQGTFGTALAENYLFTTDSFTDYLNHLNDGGLLTVVAHQQAEIYKLVSTAFEVLGKQGLSSQEIMQRIAVVGNLDDMGMGNNMNSLPVFMLSKTPITQAQATAIGSLATQEGLQNIYNPLIISTSLNPYDQNYTTLATDPHLPHLATGQMTLNDIYSIATLNLQFSTDDSPFFYNFDLGIPSTLAPLLAGAIILVIAASILYAYARRKEEFMIKDGVKIKTRAKFSGFKWYIFASLGFGFMLIEIALIQKFILFLGEPALAISFSLFSLLLAGGIGSFFSKKWLNGKPSASFKTSLAIAILIITYVFLLPAVFNATLSNTALIRFAISFALISPIGFLMGIPFPAALGYIKQEYENDAAWLWCINGAFSVLAGILALIVAMTAGFNAVLLTGAITYGLLFYMGRRHEKSIQMHEIKMLAPKTPKIKKTWQKGKPTTKRYTS